MLGYTDNIQPPTHLSGKAASSLNMVDVLIFPKAGEEVWLPAQCPYEGWDGTPHRSRLHAMGYGRH